MKQTAFNKEIWRSITHSLGRFIAIFAIVALGVGFYAGLQMTAPDMRLAADRFYDETNLFDIRVVSTMGLSESDIEKLAEVEGVQAVQPAWETDAEGEIGGEPYTFRIHSIGGMEFEGHPIAASASSDVDANPRMNDLVLVDGRMPEGPGECVISADRIMNEPVQLGDRITLTEGLMDLSDVLRETQFTVVGTVTSSYYTSSTTMGSTTLGSGTVQQFMYVPASDFAEDYPITEAFIQVEGARELESGSDDYKDVVDQVMERVNAIAAQQEQARAEELKRDAQKELDDARAEYEAERADAEDQLAQAKDQLDSALDQIQASERKIDSGQREYDDGRSQLSEQRKQAESQLSAGQQKLDEQAAQLSSTKASLTSQRQQLASAEVQLKQALALDPENEQLQQQLAQTQAGLSQVDSGLAQVEQGEKQLEVGRQQLEQQRAQAKEQLDAAQTKINQAAADLANGRVQLREGRVEYESGLAEYEENRAKADQEFADAEADLASAQADIDAIETPDWLVMDRTKNYGAESFAQDATRISHIAAVFPLIFFLVAALVALTTMTRMVDEERMLIGTYKALGYSRTRITSKYLIYAAAASISGSIVGIAALAFSLPAIIMSAYAIVYVVPTEGLQLDWPIALASAGLGVGITLVSTAAAAISTLRESPAALMLPPAPKAGKRILLERIRPIWSRLSFLWKVTCRNIFRYKKRLVMTIVGIAGCTALLLTGFGLQDSINDIIDKHFGNVVKYIVVVTQEEDASEDDRSALRDAISDAGAIAQVQAHTESMVAVGGGAGADKANPDTEDLTAEVVVPEDAQEFEQMQVLRNRLSGEQLQLEDQGVVITEKLATENGIEVGDNIVLAVKDDMGNATDRLFAVPVTGIAENYVSHKVFMTPDAYQEVFGDQAKFNTVFADIADDPTARTNLSETAQQIESVRTVGYNDETIDSYKTALKSVNMVVVVLILAAALLAFIVLYNLTNINITERIREIATLKVLGFTSREVQQYIFRETIILSILGALVGLVLGIFLENFVVVTAEVNEVMFGRDIHPLSFVLAFALTMVFTVLVMLVMRRKLANVNMVESLKSNE